MDQTLLHGTLQATIFGANLSTTTTPSGSLRPTRKTAMKRKIFSWIKSLPCCQCNKVLGEVEKMIGLGHESGKLYATIDIEKARVGRTQILAEESSKREWNESFLIYCAHDARYIIFTIKANDPIGATLIGRAYLPVEDIASGMQVDRWLMIYDEERNPLEGDSIHVRLQYFDVSKDSTNWGNGISRESYHGVPHTFFQQHQGCRVTLYQDAHSDGRFTPQIPLAGGGYYEPQRCWEDIFHAISNAQELIYIAGWSVNTDVTLIRDSSQQNSENLGELLKRRAKEGVVVLMLVWDDRTSIGLGPIRKDGIMATHDEDTESYFRGTGVKCILCPRNHDEGRSYVEDIETDIMFTHHQKIVVVDADVSVFSKRRIVSFIGGIDLCDGRYDTQDHPLFRTLNTTHNKDFHQPNFAGASIKKGGPREPWHDIHCRLEGPAAWDVLHNFEQRWKKQGSGDGFLVQLDDLFTSNELEDDGELWNVQVFRSIDGGAVVGFPEDPKEAAALGLVSGKDHVMERSIQDAYIHAIRRAKNFIYIENQYFLGSSYGWKPDDIKVEDINALHLIPKELSLKITSKIEAGERFSVYVVIPMWPEGIPESESVQAILDWQRRTMEMMYSDIARAIREKGIQASPKDYLSFFCLGNREAYRTGEYVPEERPEPDTDYMRAQQARRFMIYVHAKMMIVDDEYIIIGSANINQRSMDGGRDTEIAMGAYQPNYLTSRNQLAMGQIHGFRLALWFEHLKMLGNDFLHPESLQCMQKVNQVAKQYWNLYTSESFQADLPGHLLSYPIEVDYNGELKELMECFPDTKARIFGTKSNYLPPILTT